VKQQGPWQGVAPERVVEAGAKRGVAVNGEKGHELKLPRPEELGDGCVA
jgi:hypothetical protein